MVNVTTSSRVSITSLDPVMEKGCGNNNVSAGCLYKHEMPTDPVMLDKLGLRDIPRWYREKYGVPSLVPGGAHPGRANASNNQNWRDDSDYGAAKSIQYPSRLRYNGTPGTSSSSDTEKASKQKTTNYLPGAQQNNVPILPGNPRSGYSAMNSPRAPGSQKHGPKTTPNQQNAGNPGTGKKIDLLSFDPLPDYPTFDAMHGNMGEMPYPTSNPGSNHSNNNNKVPDEGMVRSLQSLMPGSSDYLPSPMDANPPHHPRSKKSHKPRRLYQPRSQIVVPGDSQAAFRNAQHNSSTFSSAASVASKGTNGSQMTSPIGILGGSGLSSDPPTRVASPSIHSPTSLSSASSPRAYCNRGNDKQSKLLPHAIGSKRNHRKRSTHSLDEDLFDLGVGPGNGHGDAK